MEVNKTKYIVIHNNVTQANAQYWRGNIVEVYNEDSLDYYVTLLCKGRESGMSYLDDKDKGDKLIVAIKYCTDVTNIYNKIMQLHKKTNSSAIHSILTKFKNGIFPDKSAFEYMNTIWNKLK